MAERDSVVSWTVIYVFLFSNPVLSSNFFFVHDRKIYFQAESYCRNYHGDLAVLNSAPDWDCIPRSVRFWTKNKECKLKGDNSLSCNKVSSLKKILGLDARPFLCAIDEDTEYYGDYVYEDEEISICSSPTEPPETTPPPSTPDPVAPTTILNSADSRESQSESEYGWIAGVVAGILVTIAVVAIVVLVIMKRRKPKSKGDDTEMNIENRTSNGQSGRLTGRIGTALQKCKQKFQKTSQPEIYEPPVDNRQEREYDQLSRPMLSADAIYAEPTAGGIAQDELGYLVSQGSASKEYIYIDTRDSPDGSPPSEGELNYGNPVYEDVDKREVIAGNCDKFNLDSKTKQQVASGATPPPAKNRTHEYQNSPAIGRLLKTEPGKLDQSTPDSAHSNSTYNDKLTFVSGLSDSVTKNISASATPTNEKAASADVKKNIKGSNIRNIISKLQGTSDA